MSAVQTVEFRADMGAVYDEIERLEKRLAGSPLQRLLFSDELVYSPFSKHSYYSDFILMEKRRPPQGAAERLSRHREQMEKINKAWNAKAWAGEGQSGLEYRATPDRTDGYGGYFSPPAWLNELFATANRPGRVLAGLMPHFPLPAGVSSVNVPVIGTGTAVQGAPDDAAVTDQDFTDSAANSSVVPFVGQADVALQDLEQSPQGAHLDWAIFKDLSEAYDYDLEQQLLFGGGQGNSQLLGVTRVPGIITVTYTDSTPTGSEMWPFFGQLAAQVSDARLLDPQCWLMRGARWFWLQSAEDTATRPFGISTRFYIGSDDETPDPVGGLITLPVFTDNAIPVAAGEDQVIALRPHDLILLEGQPQTMVAREPLSGAAGVRLQMHCSAAALTGRRPAGIGVLSGTGLTVQSGY